MSELKPCPFCGADSRAHHRIDLGNGCGAWSCSSCGARGPRAKRDGSDGPLIAAWSTRSTPPRAEVDVLREKAKLADEYAEILIQIRDEDGDLYGWTDEHQGISIVGMEIEDAKKWLAKWEALSRATGGNDA